MYKSSMIRIIAVSFALLMSVALISADLIVSAQNSNSSTTTQDEPTRGGMITNSNSSTPSAPRRRRRRPRRPPATPSETPSDATMTSETPSTETAMPATTSSQTGMRDPADGGMQEDLAGQSYTGTASYADGGVNGPATLAFESGNQFTLTPEGGSAMSGRYTAVTTRGYTGVTMNFSGSTPPAIVSVRLRKMGNGVSIMSVPGENRQFSFTSASGGTTRKRRPRPRRPRRGGIKPPMGQDQPTP